MNSIKTAIFYDGRFYDLVKEDLRVNNTSTLSFNGIKTYLSGALPKIYGSRLTVNITFQGYFRGMFNLSHAEKHFQMNQSRIIKFLRDEKFLADELMYSNIVPYFIPMRKVHNSEEFEEKGVDGMIATQAILKAANNEFDVLVFIGGDADHVSMIQGVHAFGKSTVLIKIPGKNQICSPLLQSEVTHVLEPLKDMKPGWKGSKTDPVHQIFSDKLMRPNY